MKVEFGNDQAIERFQDPISENPREWKVRDYPGQNITTLIIPDEQGLVEALKSVIGIMDKFYLKPGVTPNWVESDSPELEAFLKDHFKIKKSRPKTWGKKKRGVK